MYKCYTIYVCILCVYTCIYMCVHTHMCIRIVCVYSKKEKSHVTSTTYKI